MTKVQLGKALIIGPHGNAQDLYHNEGRWELWFKTIQVLCLINKITS